MPDLDKSQHEGYSLGVRLLKIVFSLYILITVLITSIHLFNEYQLQKQRIEANFITYEKIFGQAVATAYWNYDTEQLDVILKGLLGLPDIEGVRLIDTDADVVFQGGQTSQEKESIGSWDKIFYKPFDIVYEGRRLGVLYLYSSDAVVFEQVKHNFFFIFINAIIKSIVLWVLFLWAFKKYLVRALDKFVKEMESTDFDLLNSENVSNSHLSSQHEEFKSRELRRLDKVFNSMKDRLIASKAKLLSLNSNLETMVESRTSQLENQSLMLEAMSKQGRIGAWEYDLVTKQLTWSSMMREIFEVDRDVKLNIEITDSFYTKQSLQKLKMLQLNAVKEAKPWSEELTIITAKGKEIWIASTGEPVFKDGKCVRLFGSVQDIDAHVQSNQELLKSKQRAEIADKAKSEFLANMSHEIRTPMNGVIGMLHILLDSGLSSAQKEQAKLSLSSAESLLTILNDILDISKIDSGKFIIDSIDFNLRDLLNQQYNFWLNSVSQKGLSLNLQINEPFHELCQGDPVRLKQILSNLISNALKFTQYGGIEFEASAKEIGEKIEVMIRVTDTGIGIDKTKQKHIFDAFNQEDLSTTRKYGGTGLGLTIVRELLNLMQGSIELISDQGKGSSFICRLFLLKGELQVPYVDSSARNIVHLTNDSEKKSIVNKGTILLAEDQAVNQIVAKSIIEAEGFQCTIVNNGDEVINALNAEPDKYQLILMDCQMPVKDGYAATQEIRAGIAGENYKLIPIVAMTANAMKGDREKCIESGMDDYISKPITPEIVSEKLNDWYNKQHSH